MKSFVIGLDVVAVCNVNGEFCAFRDQCSHQELPLSDGELSGEVITCAHHGAEFNVRNRQGAVHARKRADRCFSRERLRGTIYLWNWIEKLILDCRKFIVYNGGIAGIRVNRVCGGGYKMNKKFIAILSVLLLAASPAMAQSMGVGNYGGLQIDISSGYYYQSADVENLDASIVVGTGDDAATANVRGVGGEVTEHGWFIAPEVAYYVPVSPSFSWGVEFEPEFMISVSSDVTADSNGSGQLAGAIDGQISGAELTEDGNH